MVFLLSQASLAHPMYFINYLLDPLVPQLSLQGSADHNEMVGFAAFFTFLSVWRALLECMSFPTMLVFVTACSLKFTFLSIFLDGIKFLSFLNTVQQNPLGCLHLYFAWPGQYILTGGFLSVL